MEVKVSLIIPVYGVENYLERAVDSALAQTLEEKELLLVEGARHIQSYLLGGDQYREKLARFFEKYDCEEGGKQ